MLFAKLTTWSAAPRTCGTSTLSSAPKTEFVAASGESAGALRNPSRAAGFAAIHACVRSEEHTSELQSLMRISYAVFCLTKTKHTVTTAVRHTELQHERQY